MKKTTDRVDRVIGRAEVLHLIPIKKSFLYNLINRGEFPAPCKIGSRSVWEECAVREWIEERLKNPPKMGRPDGGAA